MMRTVFLVSRDKGIVKFELFLRPQAIDRLKGVEQVEILFEIASQKELLPDSFFGLLSHLFPQFFVFDQLDHPLW